ncbi:hypothetical protein Hbl1158_03100 [Halobaculum sp. CBA1158]|uniref:hypothetical protein n=1 Tax=Halobaculum sp. CBA1158 TaxID=2904243 RepID=UPI001F4437FA|nr:hypothetical protein [Halobaculum sp. CBA1158]UIP00373.1 hypothetical protein Hbl1158_03100 [Halobaculum sp. CBA1158]
MTVLRLLSATRPADFAEWVRAGVAYADRVADGMGFERVGVGPADRDPLATPRETAATMRASGAEAAASTPPAVARVVARTLLGDAAFGPPFLAYTPRWYRLALSPPVALARRRLRRVAAPFAQRAADGDDGPADGDDGPAGTGDRLGEPSFSRPADLPVGEGAVRAVRDAGGLAAFERSFLLADAVLHVEWFADVARAGGVVVPVDLVERAIRESAAYYVGRRERLSPRIRRFQRHLFADDAWVRDVDTSYRLNSALFGAWERILREERRRLADD